jgi:CMP-N,N'-diacetyllegionaminic acid synthase
MCMSVRTFVAMIPARGGSKQTPQKNIATLGGKPLIAWTIEAARASSRIDRVIVTTDYRNIAEVSQDYGAEVPFIRPKELARDDTPGIEPIIHALRWCGENEKYHPDCVMVLQPTSPLRTVGDIDAAISLLEEKDADSVISVTPAKDHPWWVKKVDDRGRLSDFLVQNETTTYRQKLPAVYRLNGAVYLARRNVLLEKRTWYAEKTYAYIMPEERSLDIDTPWDLYLANLILRDQYDDARD